MGFCMLQEALQKDPVSWSPQGLAGAALLWSLGAPVLLRAQDIPEGHLHTATAPQWHTVPPTTGETSKLLLG